MNTSGNKRFQETERRIQEAFDQLLSEKGFDLITVQDICREAGISRPSYYAHYDDINDMIIQMEQEKGKQIKRILISEEPLTIAAFENYFLFLRENRVFYAAYLGRASGGSMAKSLMEDYVYMQKKHRLEHARYQMEFMMAGIRAVAYAWLMDDCRMPVRRLAEIVYKQYGAMLED